MSSSDPNLQNIPIRTELGRQVRRAFIAPKVDGEQWRLLSADYSQIELRVLAHLSEDPALLQAFRNGEDIHTATASMMFDVPFPEVNSDHRRIAKVLNFGVIYGLSAYGISQQTEFNPEEGTRFIESYFSKYPGIRGYLEVSKRRLVRADTWRRYLGSVAVTCRNSTPPIESAYVRRAHGDQHAHSGHGRRHYEARHDTRAPRMKERFESARAYCCRCTTS